MGRVFNDSVTVVSRFFLGVIFIVSGLEKVAVLPIVGGVSRSAGVPLVSLALPLTIPVEIGCGLVLLVGFPGRAVALLFIVFLLVVTFVFHNFWTATGSAVQEPFIRFLRNFAILGRLLRILSDGAGPFSLDPREQGHLTAWRPRALAR